MIRDELFFNDNMHYTNNKVYFVLTETKIYYIFKIAMYVDLAAYEHSIIKIMVNLI
jgi:hypothetical protein